jgi:hypothetical protein
LQKTRIKAGDEFIARLLGRNVTFQVSKIEACKNFNGNVRSAALQKGAAAIHRVLKLDLDQNRQARLKARYCVIFAARRQ